MILIALGANLPAADGRPPEQTCEAAVRALAGLPGLKLIARSGWHRTAPVPPSGQPDYLNGMVRLAGEPDCAVLLALLHAMEAGAGRIRTGPNAARPLDLDLIDVNGLIRSEQAPILPHPRAHLRAFVLVPLIEVAPDWRHPVLNLSAAELLSMIGDQ